MGLFSRKPKQPKVIKEIEGAAWGHLVSDHKIDVDTISKQVRCLVQESVVDGVPVTLMRIFKPSEAGLRGVDITAWESLDGHPDLIICEGYLTRTNKYHELTRRSEPQIGQQGGRVLEQARAGR